MEPEDLKAVLDRLVNQEQTPEDLALLRRAFLDGQLTVASGRGSVAIGGDVTNATILVVQDGSRVTLSSEIISRLEQRTEESPAPGHPPYKGLQYFDVEDAALFFGREELTFVLLERLRKTNFLAIVGASGSGKSSLVRAGIAAALKQDQELSSSNVRWLLHIITPREHPLESLAASLTRDEEHITSAATLAEDLAKDRRSLRMYIRRLLAGHSGSRLLLIVDQFEELFTACKDDDDRKAFLDNLLTAVDEGDSQATVIIALRADFYQHAMQFANLRYALENHQVNIGPMNEDEHRRAIELPAEAGNWEFEPGLVDLMLRDVGAEPGGLPLLSHALDETWKRRRGRTLTLAGYISSGGVQGAIARTADRVYAKLSGAQQAIARNVFLRLVDLGEETQGTRRRVQIRELVSGQERDGDLENVLAKLATKRLITTEMEYIEVAHEALIREWPLLREWLEEDREGLRLHRQLTETANQWEEAGREDGWLYPGSRLLIALEWSRGGTAQLSRLEQEFLDTSEDLVKRQETERETARQRELKQAQRLAATRRQRSIYLTIGLIVAVGLSILSFSLFGQSNRNLTSAIQANTQSAENLGEANSASTQSAKNASQAQTAEADAVEGSNALATSQVQADLQRQQAELQAQIARASELAAIALVQNATSEDLAMLLSVEALRGLEPLGLATFQSRQTLLNIWQQNPPLLQILHGHDDWVNNVAVSPDGNVLASVSDDNTIRLWNVDVGSPTFGQLIGDPLQGHESNVNSVAFSSDGAILASGSGWPENAIRLWDTSVLLNTGAESVQLLETLVGHENDINSVAFSGQGILASASDRNIWLWEVEADSAKFGQPLGEPLRGHESRVNSVAFSPNGAILASGSGDDTIRLWDLERGSETFGQPLGEPLRGHESRVNSVAFSPNGAILASGSEDDTIRLWDVERGSETFGQPRAILAGHDWGVNSVTFSPDGATLAAAGCTALDEGANCVSGEIWLWELRESTAWRIGALVGHEDDVKSITFVRQGILVSGSEDQHIRLWDTSGLPNADDGSVQPLFTLNGQEGWVWSMAFSPHGILAAVSDDTVRLWDTSVLLGKDLGTNRWSVEPLGWLEGDLFYSAFSINFSPDGAILATGSDDGIRLWDTSALPSIDGGTLQPLTEQLADHDFDSFFVAFSPDGTMLASRSNDGNLGLWNVKVGSPTFGQPLGELLSGQMSGVVSVAFSPDGTMLASGSNDGSIGLWNVKVGSPTFGQLLQEPLRGHDLSINSLAFNPDGATLASGSDDATVRLWDVDDGSPTFGQPLGEPLHGHFDRVSSVAFSPDGATLVSGSWDFTIRLWDTSALLFKESGPFNPLGEPLHWHESTVLSVAFSHDGAFFASGSIDETIQLWAAPPVGWVAELCQRAGRNLTQAEWEQFIPWKPYDPEYRTCPQWPPGG